MVIVGRGLFEHGGAGALGVALLVVFLLVLLGGEARIDGEDELAEEDGEHDAGARKGPFGLLAVVDVVGVVGDRARLCDVPWRAGLGVLGIAHVGAGLIVY